MRKAHLSQPAAYPRLLEDDLGGLFGVARRVVPEVFLDRIFVLEQHRLGTAPLATAKLRQTAFEIVVEVALHRTQGNAGKLGDLLMGQAVTLQPQHLHLTLDVRMRVLIAVGVYRFQVFV